METQRRLYNKQILDLWEKEYRIEAMMGAEPSLIWLKKHFKHLDLPEEQ